MPNNLACEEIIWRVLIGFIFYAYFQSFFIHLLSVEKMNMLGVDIEGHTLDC